MKKFIVTQKAQIYSDDMEEVKGMYKEVGEVVEGELTKVDEQEIILLNTSGFIAAKNAEEKTVEDLIEAKSKAPIQKNRKLIYGIVGAGVSYFISKAMGLNGKVTGLMMIGGFGVGIIAAIKKNQNQEINKITK